MPDVPCLNPQQFTNLLVTQLPVYVPTILRDVRPTDGLAAHVSTGQWDPFKGVSQTQDRFRHVRANVAKKWQDVSETSCGTDGPCDPVAHEICWGWARTTFSQQRQSWKSKMLCFDQMISATQAVEHVEQIVSEILRPATMDITSMYVRKKALELAGVKLLANATMSDFTLTWDTDGDEEIFATPSAFPTSKLTPEMIQRQLPRMRNRGYFGKWTNDPFFGGYDQFAELITDDDTCWDMDKIALNSQLSSQFRFTLWDAAHKYYEYGMGGQIGNYMTHIDPFSLRFNREGAKLHLVLPFRNHGTSGTAFDEDPVGLTAGLGSDDNPDYHNAQYQISFIWHRFAWRLEAQRMQSINPLCPFLVRGLEGQWQFATNDLGSDCVTGKAIENYRKNKGFFWADWRLAGHPLHTEWLTAILHLREPRVIYTVAPCATEPASPYPEQTYLSACDDCTGTYVWDMSNEADESGHYVVSADSTTCNDEPQSNGAIDAASLAALVVDLGNDAALGLLGTWSTSGNELTLTGATCRPVIPWVN